MRIIVEKDQVVQDEFLSTLGKESTKEMKNYEAIRTS